MALDVDYEKLIESHPNIGTVLPPQVLDYMKGVDKKTRDHLATQWDHNIRENVKRHLPACGWLNDGFKDFGRNKAVLAIGSGPSLKNNQDYLEMLSLADGTRPLEDQDFIFMSSNHQIKPCLNAGIIPHFAMVADGSENLKDQMDVGNEGKHTVLIAAITAHPDVVSAWKGPVKFISQRNKMVQDTLADALGYRLQKEGGVTEGGNIMNLSFTLAIALFGASAWMCVGNDLSFTSDGSVEERRNAYYSDGEYETNIKSKRDEARNHIAWAGIEFQNNQFVSVRDYVNLKIRYTSPQLFVYKTWLETNSIILWDAGFKFKIYNCSEGGILGVNPREGTDYGGKFKASNWCLMDEVTHNKWRTRRLHHAAEEFHKAKEMLRRENCLIFPGRGAPSSLVDAAGSQIRTIH